MHSSTRRRFIESGANLCKSLGIPRSLGQIYGLLYLSPQPLSLQEICEELGISKGSASQGIRQLLAWGAVRSVWIPGSRREHFTAVTDFSQILRRTYTELFKERIERAKIRLAELQQLLEQELNEGILSEEEARHVRQRLEALEHFRRRVQQLLPIIDRLV